ncbi:DUF6406 domain-containing protein [Nocardiopsis sediminis]|uniref:DUF6406 domain-containing protein n=1 Tax=Nocardiopsis sediminis TaxID=1778267 RepID=A0ABV8FUU2_9ACTN
MTTFDGARRIARVVSLATLGLVLAFGSAACGGGTEPDAAQSAAPAPVLGPDDDRLQLTEGVPVEVGAGTDHATTLRMAGHQDGDDPAVVISVGEGGGGTEHTLSLGETLDIAGEPWRVSEIGISDSASRPGSVTLTRGDG